MEPDDTRSVRVEFESADTSPITAPAAGAAPPPKRGALVLAALAVVGVAVMVLVLRPAEDETADGNVRGTTTVAPSTTQPSTVAPSSTSTSSTPVKEIVFAQAQGLFEHEEIARSGAGFLALQFEEAENGPPRLLRSTDEGLTWSSLTTTLDSPSDEPGAVVLRDYQSLISTDSGFALLMSTIRIRSDDPSPKFEVVRLTSSNGDQWTRDPAFGVVTGVNFFRPVHHSPAAFVAIGVGFTDDRLNEIARATVRADVLLGDVCFSEVIGSFDAGPGSIEFSYDCEFGLSETTVIDADDMIDPGRFVELRSCLAGRGLRSGNPNTMIVSREGIEPAQTLTLPERLVELPVVLEDGTVVVVDLDRDLRSTEICSGLLDVAPRAPALLRWDIGDAEPELFPLPLAITINFLDTPRAVGDQVLMIVDSAVWSVNVTSGDWSRLLEIPDATTPRLFEDGRGVVGLTRNAIGVSTDLNPAWDFAEFDLAPGTPSVDYADVENLIITSGTTSFVINLPFEPASSQ